MVVPARGEQLTYPQVADRIELALGVRPALSTLRAAATVAVRGVARTRVTAGMPAPYVRPDPAGRTVFSAAKVDRWLAGHPLRGIRREQDRITAAPPARRSEAVAAARKVGLSWQQIADALARADNTSYSRQAAQQRYGRH